MPSQDELLVAIRKHCLECSGGSIKIVEKCVIKQCSLYPYRCVKALNSGKQGKENAGQMNLFDMIGQ